MKEKINTALHPEILKGLKGEPEVHAFWQSTKAVVQKLLDDIENNNEKELDETRKDRINAELLYLFGNAIGDHQSPSLTESRLMSCKIVAMTLIQGLKGPCYRMGGDFFNALKNVKVDVLPELLQPAEAGYVSIPPQPFLQLVGDGSVDEQLVHGFYYWVQPNYDGTTRMFFVLVKDSDVFTEGFSQKVRESVMELEITKKRLSDLKRSNRLEWYLKEMEAEVRKKTLDQYGLAKEFVRHTNPYFINLVNAEKANIEELVLSNTKAADMAIERLKKEIPHRSSEFADQVDKVEKALAQWTRVVINTVLYIASQQPDLQKTYPEHNLTNKRKKELRAKGYDTNPFLIPVVYVSWNYKKPVMYNVDTSFVDTHMRWQPCGPNRSQVKLIWVKEHERHYKNVKKGSTDEKINDGGTGGGTPEATANP